MAAQIYFVKRSYNEVNFFTFNYKKFVVIISKLLSKKIKYKL